jgi:Ser/Thr protein kinase RdoA (MazF antagonist)
VLERLAAHVPALGDTAASLLEQLRLTVVGTYGQVPVPSHGSFRPAQVVVDSGGLVGFIDFDSFRAAEPAMDVALFCSALADTCLRSLGASGPWDGRGRLGRVEALCDRFLTAYERSAPLDRDRVRVWWQLYALTGVLHCWTKAKFDRLDYRMALAQYALRPPGILR